MATEKKSANADKGKSAISSFRYSKGGWCIATLKNGVKGIVGDTTACRLGDMLSLKGSGMDVLYEYTKDKDIDGTTYRQYRLEWSLE